MSTSCATLVPRIGEDELSDFFEGQAGSVDGDGFGGVFITRRDTGEDVVRAWGGQRGRVFEISKIEVLDKELLPLPDDVIGVFLETFLLEHARDYYRGRVDHVAFIWATGEPTIVDYPSQ